MPTAATSGVPLGAPQVLPGLDVQPAAAPAAGPPASRLLAFRDGGSEGPQSQSTQVLQLRAGRAHARSGARLSPLFLPLPRTTGANTPLSPAAPRWRSALPSRRHTRPSLLLRSPAALSSPGHSCRGARLRFDPCAPDTHAPASQLWGPAWLPRPPPLHTLCAARLPPRQPAPHSRLPPLAARAAPWRSRPLRGGHCSSNRQQLPVQAGPLKSVPDPAPLALAPPLAHCPAQHRCSPVPLKRAPSPRCPCSTPNACPRRGPRALQRFPGPCHCWIARPHHAWRWRWPRPAPRHTRSAPGLAELPCPPTPAPCFTTPTLQAPSVCVQELHLGNWSCLRACHLRDTGTALQPSTRWPPPPAQRPACPLRPASSPCATRLNAPQSEPSHHARSIVCVGFAVEVSCRHRGLTPWHRPPLGRWHRPALACGRGCAPRQACLLRTPRRAAVFTCITASMFGRVGCVYIPRRARFLSGTTPHRAGPALPPLQRTSLCPALLPRNPDPGTRLNLRAHQHQVPRPLARGAPTPHHTTTLCAPLPCLAPCASARRKPVSELGCVGLGPPTCTPPNRCPSHSRPLG
jgi:hypothetical protein